METREIRRTEARIYVLVLNTFGAAEDGAVAAWSDDYQKLVDFYFSQISQEGHRDGAGFYHSFVPGPFYYFNPCHTLELNNCGLWGHGIHDEWVDINALHELSARFYRV